MAKRRTAKKKSVKKPKKKTARKTARKTTKKKTTRKKRKPNPAFMKPMKISDALSKIVGSKAIPRTEVVKKLWVYIKRHKLQDRVNRRMINADANLRAVLGKAKVTMFEMTKLVSKHLK
jgi:chromatin remodeling complex protein RSC6